MIRTLYRCLLQLHPPAFRRRFAGEMLWIFEETWASSRAGSLLLDGLLSLLRQWLLRSGSWKVAGGAIGGFLEIMACIALMASAHKTSGSHPASPQVIADRLSGHWQGNFRWPGPFGEMSLTLSNLGTTPSGEVHVRLENGERRSGRVGTIRIENDSFSFPVRIGDSDLTFRGRLVDGTLGPRLSGVLGPEGCDARIAPCN
jgi:hypothetical protein